MLLWTPAQSHSVCTSSSHATLRLEIYAPPKQPGTPNPTCYFLCLLGHHFDASKSRIRHSIPKRSEKPKPLFRRDVLTFFGSGAFHQQHQKGEYNGNHRENQESIEIGKSRGLLFAKILQRL